MTRARLILRRETLAELDAGSLGAVVGGGTTTDLLTDACIPHSEGWWCQVLGEVTELLATA